MLCVVTAGLAFSASTKPTPPEFAGDFYTGEQASVVLNQGGYKSGALTCCSVTDSPACKVQAVNSGLDVREQASMKRTRMDSPTQGSIVNWWGDVGKQMAVVPGGAVNSTHDWACVQAADGRARAHLRACARAPSKARAPAHPPNRAPAHPPTRPPAHPTPRPSTLHGYTNSPARSPPQYCPLDPPYISDVAVGDKKMALGKPKYAGTHTVKQEGAPGAAVKECDTWKWALGLFILPFQKITMCV